MKAREWWLDVDAGYVEEFENACSCEKPIHVREVLPDTVTISERELSTLIGEAMGFASVCWSEMPNGVFDSSACEKHLNELMRHIRQGSASTDTTREEK